MCIHYIFILMACHHAMRMKKKSKRKSRRKSKRNYLKNINQIQHLRFKIQRPIVGQKFWTSSIEIELTRSSLFFLLLFFFSKCLNLEDVLSVFFFRDPILVLVSSSQFSKSNLLSFFSSLPENHSKPATITKTKCISAEKRNGNLMRKCAWERKWSYKVLEDLAARCKLSTRTPWWRWRWGGLGPSRWEP